MTATQASPSRRSPQTPPATPPEWEGERERLAQEIEEQYASNRWTYEFPANLAQALAFTTAMCAAFGPLSGFNLRLLYVMGMCALTFLAFNTAVSAWSWSKLPDAAAQMRLKPSGIPETPEMRDSLLLAKIGLLPALWAALACTPRMPGAQPFLIVIGLAGFVISLWATIKRIKGCVRNPAWRSPIRRSVIRGMLVRCSFFVLIGSVGIIPALTGGKGIIALLELS